MSKRSKVLLVDADGWWHDEWFRRLGSRVGLHGEITLVSALSVREAEDQFVANPDVAVVVVDAGSNEESPVTLPLVRNLRAAHFKGAIVALGTREQRQKLMSAGCDHESAKKSLPRKLVEVLG